MVSSATISCLDSLRELSIISKNTNFRELLLYNRKSLNSFSKNKS